MTRYRAPDADALLHADLDAFTAVFHRQSGITHLLTSPAPEILMALAAEPMDADALLNRLSLDYQVADADRASLMARLDELVAAGLLSPA